LARAIGDDAVVAGLTVDLTLESDLDDGGSVQPALTELDVSKRLSR
jgi:hypothetical protein